MTAPHSISDGSAEALEYLSVFTDSGYYGLSNVQVRAICAALRSPALPSGEVENRAVIIANAQYLKQVAFEFEDFAASCNDTRKMRGLQKGIAGLRKASEQLREVASSPTQQIAGDARGIASLLAEFFPGKQAVRDRCTTAILAALSPQPQHITPPFSRWADTIESASLTISPEGSKELDALAAEVRGCGGAQRGNYEDRHPSDMVLHPLTEIREWDEANAVLGIQDSTQTAPEAIRELFAEIEQLRGAAQAGWRTDFENAPSPCLGWCTPPAGDDVRMIYRHSYVKGAWTSHSVTQTVKAWQPLPSISSTSRMCPDCGRPVDGPTHAAYCATDRK